MLGEDSRPSYCTGYQSRPLSPSNTGSTALRLAEVQQPKTQATLSCCSSFFDFSAKVGQSDAPSSTTGMSCLPITPPAALISAIASSEASRTDTSEIDIVPLSECSTPTLMPPPESPLLLLPDEPPSEPPQAMPSAPMAPAALRAAPALMMLRRDILES